MEYFSKLAAGEKLDSQKTFKSFYSIDVLKSLLRNLVKGAVRIDSDDIYQDLFKILFKHGGKIPKEIERKYGHDANLSLGIALAKIKLLWRNFKKLEFFICKTKRNEERKASMAAADEDWVDSSPEKEFFSALKARKFSILTKQQDVGVHAEAQIVAEVVALRESTDIDEEEVYIGISKLCCKHCHALRDAANEVLAEQYADEPNLVFHTRGDHDIDFGEKWVPPKEFRFGFESKFSATRKKALTIQDQIGRKTKEKYDSMCDEHLRDMHAPPSRSRTPEDQSSLSHNLDLEIEVLNRTSLALSGRAGSAELVNYLQTLKVIQKFVVSDLYEDILLACDVGEEMVDSRKVAAQYATLRNWLKDEREVYEEQHLRVILRQAYYVGGVMSRFFSLLPPNDDLQQGPSAAESLMGGSGDDVLLGTKNQRHPRAAGSGRSITPAADRARRCSDSAPVPSAPNKEPEERSPIPKRPKRGGPSSSGGVDSS